jgi:hypothetical protein
MSAVPNVHRNPAITPRPPRELRDRSKEAATKMDTDLNAAVIAFLRWYVRDTDDLPARVAERVPPLPETETGR